jgi:hypothetical protein
VTKEKFSSILGATYEYLQFFPQFQVAFQMMYNETFKRNSMTTQIAFEWFLMTLAVDIQRPLGGELLLADWTFKLLLLFLQLVQLHVFSVGTCFD